MLFQIFTKKGLFCPYNPPKIMNAFMFFLLGLVVFSFVDTYTFSHKSETIF